MADSAIPWHGSGRDRLLHAISCGRFSLLLSKCDVSAAFAINRKGRAMFSLEIFLSVLAAILVAQLISLTFVNEFYKILKEINNKIKY